MLPRIEAGERLASIGDAALAAGNLSPADARAMSRRLSEAAQGERRRAAKATPEVLAAMGVGVVIAPAASTAEAHDG